MAIFAFLLLYDPVFQRTRCDSWEECTQGSMYWFWNTGNCHSFFPQAIQLRSGVPYLAIVADCKLRYSATVKSSFTYTAPFTTDVVTKQLYRESSSKPLKPRATETRKKSLRARGRNLRRIEEPLLLWSRLDRKASTKAKGKHIKYCIYTVLLGSYQSNNEKQT